MKGVFKKTHIIYLFIFLAGAAYSAVLLYHLPGDLERGSDRIDLNVIQEISPVLDKTFLVIGITLLAGVAALIRLFYLLNVSEHKEKIVYIEKSSVDKEEEKDSEEKELHENNVKIAKEIRSAARNAKSPHEKFEKILSGVCMKIDASQGIYYTVKKGRNNEYIEMLSSFAYSIPESKKIRYEFGEGLAGQVAREGKKVNISDVPEGYISIISGLGKSSPRHLAILPVKDKGKVVGVVEIASFREISSSDEELISEALRPVKEEGNKIKKTAAKKAGENKPAGSKKSK